jgi:hypothetical protein
MSRTLSTVLALVLLLEPAFLVASGFPPSLARFRRAVARPAVALAEAGSRTAPQGSDSPADVALKSGITCLEQTEYSQALKEFDRALDLFAASQRLEDAQRAYMQLFVAHRSHASMLMRAMKTWVERRRNLSSESTSDTFMAFESWVEERDALAAATINLVHNSPDWK